MIITRRNWLLRCSILANIAVLLYICSHVMIGRGNFSVRPPAYLIQDDANRIHFKHNTNKNSMVCLIIQPVTECYHELF